ncbi:MAG: hypothetical protein VW739_04305 [Pelagibacteraceae bacterium]
MEMFKHANMRGTMFPADKKGNDKAPDMRGFMNINGENYVISGWNQITRQEVPYITLSLSNYKPKEIEGEA